MRVVFGISSFRVKKFSLAELELPVYIEEKLAIELRQYYFHIFFIPFFWVGKNWIMKKNGRKVEMYDDYKTIIMNKHSGIKTPWYYYFFSFTGPILILLFGLGLYSTLLIQDYVNYKSRKEKLEKNYECLNKPLKGDYYFFCNESAKCYNFKIDSLTNQSILFKVPLIDSLQNNYIDYSEEYIDTATRIRKVWVEKNILKKVFFGENSFKNTSKGYPIKPLYFILPGNIKLLHISRKGYLE